MSIVINQHRCFERPDDVIESIRDRASLTIELGKKARTGRADWLSVGTANRCECNVVIYSMGMGAKVGWHAMGDNLLIGYNDRVASVASAPFRLNKELDLFTLFVEFLSVRLPDRLVVLGESAVIGVNGRGDELWRRDVDLITDYSLHESTLTLQQMDAPSCSLNIEHAFLDH